MTIDYRRAPWTAPRLEPTPSGPMARPPSAASLARPPRGEQGTAAQPLPEPSENDFVGHVGVGPEEPTPEHQLVVDLVERVSTRLTAEDRNYAPAARRELTKKLTVEELEQWVMREASHGRPAPQPATEDSIISAVLAELDGLGRFAPLLARDDVEDVHFEGCQPTMLRLGTGRFVAGPPIADSDEDLLRLLRSIGARSGDGQTSRELSSARPILNVRLKGVTDLGARLQAAMDVLPRPAGVIRVHRYSDPSLDDLRDLEVPMIDSPLRAFLHHAVLAGASQVVTGNPAAGKTTLLRALGNAIPWDNVVVTVEDERELGLHLPRWDPARKQHVQRFAVCRSFESRLPNSEGRGGFGMGDALNEALRMSTTWCLVGEVRGGYVIHMLEAVTSGLASVMCTIHSPTPDDLYKKVLINALKAPSAPSQALVVQSLEALDLVIHVHRDRDYQRFVSGVYELGPGGDAGRPALRPIFKPRRGDGRAVPVGPGALSESLAARLSDSGFDLGWLRPEQSDWGSRRGARAL